MTTKYKGYNKKNTSDRIMRIDKREPILAYIIANPDKFKKVSPEEAELLHTKYGRIKGNKEWQFANTVSLEVSHEDEEIFNSILDHFDASEWFKGYVDESDTCRIYFDTRKLRNYYKWTHKGPDQFFYIERILKYMYTGELFKMYLKYHDVLDRRQHIFMFPTLEEGDVAEIAIWLNDVHNIYASVYEASLFFKKPEYDKFVKLLK